MGQFVDQDLLVESRRSVGSRAVEDKHLHASRRPVRRSQEVGVTRAGEILRLGQNAIIAEATPAEVVVLEVSGRFGEAQLVEPVVVPIGPEEHVDDLAETIVGESRSVARRRNSRRGIVQEVEHASWRAGGPSAHVYAVRRDQIQTGVNVIASGRIISVREPAQVVKCRPFADQSERGARYGSALYARARQRVRR